MRALWLDDARDPSDSRWAHYLPENHEVIWVKNCKQFIGWIIRYGIPDWVCFDFDLDEYGDGLSAANLLIQHCCLHDLILPKFSSQSSNKNGRDKILKVLSTFRDQQNEKLKEKYITHDWRKIGIVDVDAGLCWIGDPCYLANGKGPMQDWRKFCDQLDHENGHQKWQHELGHDGLGVSVSTGYGDGSYNVYAKKIEGRISEVKVVFISDEDEDDDRSSN